MKQEAIRKAGTNSATLTVLATVLVTVMGLLLPGSAVGQQTPGGITDQGAITQWLVLGPYSTNVGCNLPATFDFLTDGVAITGDEWEPQAGDEVATDCGNAAACVAWLCPNAAMGDSSIDCSESLRPRVSYFDSPEPRGYIDLNNFWSGSSTMGGNGGSGPPENVMGYSWTYVNNLTGSPLTVMIGHNSDDSYRILVNHVEVGSGLACRPPNPDTYDQEVLGPVTLDPGRNLIMTQTWEGCCNWGFRIRLFDPETLQPILLGDIELETAPPFLVVRDVPDSPAPGSIITVTIDIQNSGPPVSEVEVRERIPRYWHAESPSPPGIVETDAAGKETVVWKLTGGVDAETLTYDFEVPDPFANVTFRGSTAIADGTPHPIFGDGGVTGGIDPNVGEALVITMLQPTTGCAGNNPGLAAQAQDYLTDGDESSEQVIAPVAGESVSPDFGGVSPSPGPTSASSLTWTRMGTQPGGWFQLNTCEDCMSYVAFYVVNPTGETQKVRIGSSSDDGEQILVDGIEVWNNSIPRGAATGSPQDHTEVFDLTPGKHLVLQKVFEGCGGFDSSIRFEDDESNPLVNLRYTIDPAADKPLAGDPPYDAGRAFVIRDVPSGMDVGESGKVLLKLRIKTPPIVDGTVEENVPEGFLIDQITGGGVRAGQKITWTFTGSLSNQDLSYRITIPENSVDAAFDGTAVLGGRASAIAGDRLFRGGIMNAAGFIKHWLVLGPLDTFGVWPGDPLNPQGNPDAPSATPEDGDLHLDFLTDGTLTEKNIRPFDGMRISPVFNGTGGDGITSSKAVGLEPLTRECSAATPTWERVVTASGTFDNTTYFGEDIDSHTTYAASYVTNTTGAPIATNIAVNSDDAFIAFLNGSEAVFYEPGPCSAAACGRGYGGEDSVVEVMPVTLPPGESFLLTRVHDGFGGSGHRLRFQDAAGVPLLPPAITVSTRSTASPPAVYVRRMLSSDSYQLGKDPLTVTLRVQSSGSHNVAIKEVLPLGWTAGAISDGGALAAGQIAWNLAGVSGERNLSYQLVPGECPAGGSFCGGGPGASDYTVDGTATHTLRGDSSFRRETRGTDDLSPWTVRDFGFTGGGAQRVGPHAVDVSGKGAGVRLTKDEFRFISLPNTGDFDISARIDCMDDPGGAGQGGLMVRDTFDQFSAHVFFALSTTAPAAGGVGTLKGTLRRETNKSRTSSPITISDKDVVSLPIYLKIKRAGTKISLQRSSDGTTYSEVATRDIGPGTTNQVNLRADTQIGLAVTGGGGTSRVDFRSVSGPEFPDPSQRPNAPRNLTAVKGNQKVDLSWDEPAPGGLAFTGYAVLRDGVKVADLPLLPRSYSNGGLVNGTRYCFTVQATAGAVIGASSNEACATPEGQVGPLFRRGDTDANGSIELTDAVKLLNWLFLGQAKPECVDAADADDNGDADISDAIANLNYQFLGAVAPAPPGPINCGLDANQESPDLGCDVSCR